jgi:hypothetical protein
MRIYTYEQAVEVVKRMLESDTFFPHPSNHKAILEALYEKLPAKGETTYGSLESPNKRKDEGLNPSGPKYL